MRLLYLTYDGLTDPIGQSQILPYLIGCAERGHQIHVISFEKAAKLASLGPTVRAICAESGLTWQPERFHGSPPFLSKAYDFWRMERAAVTAVRHSAPFDLVHARSYQAGWIALKLKRALGLPMLFDMRGFWADQRREGGRWPDSSPIGHALYRQWKSREAEMLAEANHVVVLSEAARNEVMNWTSHRGQPVSVIPCCADFALFDVPSAAQREQKRKQLGIGPDDPVLGYLGSTGTVYRYDIHLKLFDKIRSIDRRARLLHVGADRAEAIMAQAATLGIGLSAGELIVRSAERSDLPGLIGVADVATAFYTDSFYSKGVSPTKIAECLACGVPMIGNDAVGDTAAQLHELSVGHSIPDFSEASLDTAATQFFEWKRQDRKIIRDRARTMFDLPLAVKAYAMIYDSLTPLRLPEE